MTNATKAHIAIAVNAGLGAVAEFGFLTTKQTGSIGIAVNAVLAAIVALTYKRSAKRVPDAPTA